VARECSPRIRPVPPLAPLGVARNQVLAGSSRGLNGSGNAPRRFWERGRLSGSVRIWPGYRRLLSAWTVRCRWVSSIVEAFLRGVLVVSLCVEALESAFDLEFIAHA